MKRVDANVILRYLLADHPEFTERATRIMETESVTISCEVICEVVYVLGGVYEVTRDEISNKLSELVKFENVETADTDVLCCAFRTFAKKNVDFVDALLFAHHHLHGDQVYTFDKKLNRLIDI